MTDSERPSSSAHNTIDDNNPFSAEGPATAKYLALPSEARATVPEINTATRDKILKLMKEGYEIASTCPPDASTETKKAFADQLSKYKFEGVPYQITATNGDLTLWIKKTNGTQKT